MPRPNQNAVKRFTSEEKIGDGWPTDRCKAWRTDQLRSDTYKQDDPLAPLMGGVVEINEYESQNS